MNKQNKFMRSFIHLRMYLHGSAKGLIKKKMVAPLIVGTLLRLISARIHFPNLKRLLSVSLSMPLHSMGLLVMKSSFALEE